MTQAGQALDVLRVIDLTNTLIGTQMSEFGLDPIRVDCAWLCECGSRSRNAGCFDPSPAWSERPMPWCVRLCSHN